MKEYDVKINIEDILTRSVTYETKYIKLNETMIEKQELKNKDVEKLLYLHKKKLMIIHDMANINDTSRNMNMEFLRACDTKLDQLEFALQVVWGFEQNSNYHRFWDRPHCECPKLDNDDAYPTGHYVISGKCPLHGLRSKDGTPVSNWTVNWD